MLQCNVASTTCSNLLAWRKVLTFGWGSPCSWLCMLACAPTRQQLTCSPASSGKMRRGLVAVWLLELQSTWQWTYILSSWSHQPWFKQLHGLGQLWAKNSWRRTNGWNKGYGKTSGSSRLAKLWFNQTFRDSDMCWETQEGNQQQAELTCPHGIPVLPGFRFLRTLCASVLNLRPILFHCFVAWCANARLYTCPSHTPPVLAGLEVGSCSKVLGILGRATIARGADDTRGSLAFPNQIVYGIRYTIQQIYSPALHSSLDGVLKLFCETTRIPFNASNQFQPLRAQSTTVFKWIEAHLCLEECRRWCFFAYAAFRVSPSLQCAKTCQNALLSCALCRFWHFDHSVQWILHVQVTCMNIQVWFL